MTVRTLESMIRLATAHSKLRLATHVDVEDLDIACKLLNQTIFNEHEQEEPESQADEEMEEANQEDAPKDDDVVPLARKAGRAMRARRGRGGDKDDEDDEEMVQNPAAAKRAKLDHKEEVNQLFGASTTSIVDD